MRFSKRLLGLLVAGLFLSACTFVPADSQPQTISSKLVPFDLLSKNPPTPPPPKPIYEMSSVWLINGNRELAPRPRRVPSQNAAAESVQALFAGPTDHESALGFTSEAPATWRVQGVGSLGGMIFLRLTGPPGAAKSPISALESGQIVLTAAGTTDQIVEVLINNQVLKLTTPNGQTALQVRPSDYGPLVAR